MAAAAAFDLQPGFSVGPFELGATVNEAIALCRRLGAAVEIHYAGADSLTVTVPDRGLELRFDADQQRLFVIHVTNPRLCLLKLGRRALESAPTFLELAAALGPTFPGQFDGAVDAYVLRYPGLTALFPIPEEYRAMYGPGSAAVPNELPNGATPACQRLFVFAGELGTPPPAADGVVRVSSGPMHLSLPGGAELSAGDSPQDVIAAIGGPATTLAKPRSGSDALLDPVGVFYNYPALGLDLLFDPESRLTKAVLHTNAPGHQAFGQHRRCNFAVDCGGGVELTPQTRWAELARTAKSQQLPAVNSSSSADHPFGASLFHALAGGDVIVEVTMQAPGQVATVAVS